MHPIAQGLTQTAEAAKTAVLLAAVALVVFWRLVIRLVLALITIAILVAVGVGVVALAGAAHQ
jgi:hypothetical protein